MNHCIDIDSLSDNNLRTLIDRAVALESGKAKPQIFKNKQLFTCFFEPSTRTRMSFESAAKRLGIDVLNFNINNSSISKGESEKDTITTLNAMAPDAFIVRHTDSDFAHMVRDWVDCPIINGGTGTKHHPTQALLDAATIQKHFGRIETLKIAICGDVAHSRVAHSNYTLLKRLGAEITTCDSLIETINLEDAVKGRDVIMMLRIQRERIEDKGGLMATHDYYKEWGLDHDKVNALAPKAKIMHPGPFNRDVEISSDLIDDPDKSLYHEQVRMGVFMRMAILEWCLND